MKKLVVFLLLLSFCGSLFADELPQYEPYKKEEFPIWTYKLRRGETLFFGSLAITYPLAALSYNLINTLGGNLPTEPALNVVLYQAAAAGVLSLGIVLADYFIGEAEAKNAK